MKSALLCRPYSSCVVKTLETRTIVATDERSSIEHRACNGAELWKLLLWNAWEALVNVPRRPRIILVYPLAIRSPCRCRRQIRLAGLLLWLVGHLTYSLRST